MKINIGTKDGKTIAIELEAEKARALYSKKIGDTIAGETIQPELANYELKITGLSNETGFPARADLPGTGVKRVLLTKGIGMKGKGGKLSKKRKIKGLRLRKSIRGNTIAQDIKQINTTITKEGPKKLNEIFKSEKPAEKAEQPKEQPKEKQEKTEEKPKEAEKPEEQKEQPAEKKEKPAEKKQEEKK